MGCRRRRESPLGVRRVLGKKQLAGDTVREATSDEVKELRAENSELKEVVAEFTLKNRVLKKSLTGLGEQDDT